MCVWLFGCAVVCVVARLCVGPRVKLSVHLFVCVKLGCVCMYVVCVVQFGCACGVGECPFMCTCVWSIVCVRVGVCGMGCGVRSCVCVFCWGCVNG